MFVTIKLPPGVKVPEKAIWSLFGEFVLLISITTVLP